MRLGQEVLSKIENLLTRIDQKETRPRQSRKKAEENTDNNSTFIKLHEDYKKKLNKLQQIQAEKENYEKAKLSPFKITNKHTIFLISQLQQPPIHQRLQQLRKQKNEELMRLREKYPKLEQKEAQHQNELEELQMEERKKHQKRFTLRQSCQKVQQLQMKEAERQQRLNLLKVKAIEQHSKDYRCKPYVNTESSKIWKSFKLKKQLSSSVFERFQQYEMQRRTNFQKTERRVRNEVTPFIPKISQNSKLIASRCSSKSNLHQKITRSVSCKCLQRTKSKKQNTSTALHSSRKH